MAGTVKASIIQHDVSNVATVFKDGAGTEVGQFCKAWGNFNGSTPATNASYNISSFTRVATGYYAITMTTAQSDSNYSIGTNHQYSSGSTATDSDDLFGGWLTNSNSTSSTFWTFTRSSGNGMLNCFKVLCHIFR